jgi:hypothetical protein
LLLPLLLLPLLLLLQVLAQPVTWPRWPRRQGGGATLAFL